MKKQILSIALLSLLVSCKREYTIYVRSAKQKEPVIIKFKASNDDDAYSQALIKIGGHDIVYQDSTLSGSTKENPVYYMVFDSNSQNIKEKVGKKALKSASDYLKGYYSAQDSSNKTAMK